MKRYKDAITLHVGVPMNFAMYVVKNGQDRITFVIKIKLTYRQPQTGVYLKWVYLRREDVATAVTVDLKHVDRHAR